MAGLYIHIPYCVSKCRYCDFVSFADHSDWEKYFAALIAECRIWKDEMNGVRFDTVFIGGGTPSIVPAKITERIMAEVRADFTIAQDAEITLECNPGTVDSEKLELYRKAGINRLSIGLQSASDLLLQNIGRIHDYSQFLEAYGLAREAGFRNINVDIMYGLPEQSVSDHLDTIHKVAALGAEHISAYCLILEESTPLYMDVNGGSQSLPDEDTAYEMHAEGIALLEKLGYERYEISNYAKPGYRSRHNLNYWDNGEYLGLGLNSHSAFHIGGGWMRWANTSDIDSYIGKCSEGEKPYAADPEKIMRAEEMFETVMLGLRKIDGVRFDEFKLRYGENLQSVFRNAIDKLVTTGMAQMTDNALKLTPRGLDIQNTVLLEFMD